MRLTKLIFGLSFLAMVSVGYSQEWPQFLGPDRNSHSPEKGILRSWPESGPEVLWITETGIGFGGPVIKGGKAYLLDRDDATGDIFRCFDMTDGRELWSYSYDSPGEVQFPGSRSVPAIDDRYAYSCGPYGDLYCFDVNSRQPVWNRNVWKDFGGEEIPTWAISQCPLIYGDLLIIASQAPEAGVVAYDKLSGDVKWKTPSLGRTGYVSPVMVKIDGNDHVVMVTASGGGRGGQPLDPGNVVGIDPLSGRVLWEFKEWTCSIPIPGAVDAGDNRLLITGGYELGVLMLKVEKSAGGEYAATELFRSVEFGDQTKPPVLIDGYFYGQYGTNNRRDGMACMDMEGNVMWKTKRSPDFNKGSMIVADGLILATDGSNTLYLVEPDPSGFKALAKSKLLGNVATSAEGSIAARVGGPTQNWAPIALAGGKLLIRDQSHLYCIKVAE